jgi:diaminobutyrate-2-oxoglutarate transaminase
MTIHAAAIATDIIELAETDPETYTAYEEVFAEHRRRGGLFFEQKLDPVSLRPLPLAAPDDLLIREAAAGVLALLEKAAVLYRSEQIVRDFFPAYTRAEHWLLADPGLSRAAGICRLDGVFADGRFRIMEASTGGPGGVIKVGAELRLWREAVGEILGVPAPDFGDQPFGHDPLLFIRHLLDQHEEQYGDQPDGAAVVGLANEFANEVNLIVGGLNQFGVPAGEVDARQLRRTGERGMLADERRISLTFNKLDQVRLINDPAAAPYLDAMAAGEISMAPTLLAHCVLDDKSLLAFLTDPGHAGFFTAEELGTIERHIPWTRVIRPGRTTDPDGGEIDLLGYALACQSRLVLKPNDRTRGEGLLIGPETATSQWAEAVGAAARRGDSVVQEYLPLPEVDVPFGDPPSIKRMKHGLDVFLFGGKFAGYMCRASVDTVINVGKRGVMLPVIAERAEPA